MSTVSLETTKIERNYGIDLLKIVSMIMVLILHILVQGGVLERCKEGSANNHIGWFLEIGAYCAVNCFAIVSGYVYFKSKHKYANILYLNLQVTFLLLISITIFKIRYPNLVTLTDFKKASMPFAYYVLWYYRAYFCMFFFIPFMNILVDKLTRNQGRLLVYTIFILFSFIPTMFNGDTYLTSYGYSALWLAMMYLVGAYFSKFEVQKEFKWWVLVIIFIASTTFTFFWRKIPIGLDFFDSFLSYTSPTILINGMCLVLLFSMFKFHKPSKMAIKFFVPLAFSVYIIHVSPYFWQKFMLDRFTYLAKLNPFIFPFAVIGTAILLFICFALIDYVRYLLFKICKVKEFFIFLEKKIRQLCSKIFKEESIDEETIEEVEVKDTEQEENA